jgi:hypothetical protein
MADTYQVRSTSRRTARVHDIWLDPPEVQEAAHTRRVLRVELIDNIHSEEARVKACLLHQKRHSSKDSWRDVDAFNLATLKAGQEIRLKLDTAETLHLFRELERLYAAAAAGIPQGEKTLVVASSDEVVLAMGRAREVVRDLIAEGDEELWDELQRQQPSLFKALMLTKLHELRERAVAEFELRLNEDVWSEGDWQEFFEQNTWIFGYGLDYRFLRIVESQPDYGGRTLRGSGSQRGDFLMSTDAEARFTVLVEIKKPSSLLVGKEYRNGAHLIGRELAGGLAQLQANCRTWEREGSRQEANLDRLRDENVHTYLPRAILVIGHTKQLDSREKLSTFELFRANLHNPDVVTFDELLMRSRALLLNARAQTDS